MNIFLAQTTAPTTPANTSDSTENTSAEPSPADLIQAGQQQYMLCGACHGQQGEGTAAAPPLAGSEWVNGPAENLIKIQLRGLTGPITVKGVEYNIQPGMMPMAYQTDEQIAGVLSYIRANFGNNAPPVTVAEVAALRSEVGKPMITAAELIQPEVTISPATTEQGEPIPIPEKYKHLESSIGLPTAVIAFIPIFTLVCLVAVFKK